MEIASDVNLILDRSASYTFCRLVRYNKPMTKKMREREMLHTMCSGGSKQPHDIYNGVKTF